MATAPGLLLSDEKEKEQKASQVGQISRGFACLSIFTHYYTVKKKKITFFVRVAFF